MIFLGFFYLIWWEYFDDWSWYNECSFWMSCGVFYDWYKNIYYKYCKLWVVNGVIMEDIIINFEFVGICFFCVCLVCNYIEDKKYDLVRE